MLLHLAPAASAAHAQVFHRAAKAGLLVSLEVAQGKNYVGLHNGLADFGGLNVLRPGYRDLHIVVAPQAVADDNHAGEKPFSKAASRCSRAFFLRPG